MKPTISPSPKREKGDIKGDGSNVKFNSLFVMNYKEKVAGILNDDSELERLGAVIADEFLTDDEPFEDKARTLLQIWQDHPDIANNVTIALVGWSIESLIDKL